LSSAAEVHAQSEGPPTGLDYVHFRLAAGVQDLELHSRYDIRVARPDGRYGLAQFSEERSGVGPVLLGGFGFLFLRNFVAGARAEYARVYAPLRHSYLPEIGAEFAPWITVWGGGLFGDLRFSARGWHAGGALSYRRVVQSLAEPEGEGDARGYYTPELFAGYRQALVGELGFDVSVHASAAFAAYLKESATSLSLLAGLEFR
jgi:hypothetical protein